MVDYRKLRLSNLNSKEFRHLYLLLFWAVFGIYFLAVERLIPMTYHPIWCPLDDMIPFCEWFFIPYIFWFVFVIGMHIYLLLYDIPAFKRFMYFIILTHVVTMVVFLAYPSCQELRPVEFPRDNFMTRFAAMFYAFDTNTNVCPSLHCVCSLAVAFAAWDTERFQHWAWKAGFMGMALLISAATVLVKQHSFVDVFWAYVLSLVAYVLVYVLPARKKTGKQLCSEQETI